MMAHRSASYGLRLGLPLALVLWAVILNLLF
jgi:hypothetical protein